MDALRGHLADDGVVVPTGAAHLVRLRAHIEGEEGPLPGLVIELARMLLGQIGRQCATGRARQAHFWIEPCHGGTTAGRSP